MKPRIYQFRGYRCSKEGSVDGFGWTPQGAFQSMIDRQGLAEQKKNIKNRTKWLRDAEKRVGERAAAMSNARVDEANRRMARMADVFGHLVGYLSSRSGMLDTFAEATVAQYKTMFLRAKSGEID